VEIQAREVCVFSPDTAACAAEIKGGIEMLAYVAAVATAATLMISPILAGDGGSVKKREAVRALEPAKLPSTQIPTSILIVDAAPPYVLSDIEQRILKRALLRSVRIVHSGIRMT
jgi:hypothetical protein